MATVEVKYTIPPAGGFDGSSVINGSQVDVTFTLSDTPNADGSYTVTGATGVFQTTHSVDGAVSAVNTDTITGVGQADISGVGGGNDNELFIVDDPGSTPIVTGGGVDFTISSSSDANGGNVDFYDINGASAGTVPADMPSYRETNTSNNSAATNVTETVITPPCYVTGTLIATTRGAVAVEQLSVGDLVVTAAGRERPIKWIGHRGFAGRFANTNPDLLPICFKAGALADNVPTRDLWVSPKHAMFLDGALFPAEVLVNGVSVIKAEHVESVTYWHVELDSHDVLIAEGAASESFVDDDSRGIFHNAHTFATMYPEAPAPAPVTAVYCAPRLEEGHQLEAVRRAIAARAGLAAAAPDCGALHGYIDALDGAEVRGWVRSALNPAMPVCLDLVVDGRVVTQALANRPRADLEAAGYGPHAFAIALPAGTVGRRVEVRRSADGARLKTVLDRAA